MKRLISGLLLFWGVGAIGFWYWNESRRVPLVFETVSLTRDDLAVTINATGTIEPEEIVDVGPQIPGVIASFGPDPRNPSKAIDYGSPVEAGTVLARLDDALLKVKVEQAQARLDHAKAQIEPAQIKLRQAELDLQRARLLFQKSSITNQELDQAINNHEAAKADLAVLRTAVAITQADLDEAQVNLGYATIKSPIRGVIIDRRVNLGQTVVSALNATSLFLIATDLDRLEIWAAVNESDITSIHPGQRVRFSVSSLPDETFEGVVSSLRLNASMTQNVVIYTVVVKVDNQAGRLLPYLTARVQFEVAQHPDVLLVPNTALRWRPTPEQVAPEHRAAFELARSQPPAGSSAGSRTGTLWLPAGQFVRPLEVQIGATDGNRTEIIRGDVRPGDQVVAGTRARQTDDGVDSPFLPQIKNRKSAP